MASILLSHSFNGRKTASVIQECHTQRISPRSFSMLVISCQSNEPSDHKSAKTEKQINKGVFPQLIFGVGKFGKGLKDNLSPKQKGDWKDLTLMSLSFAVYVYISQKLVCAYCAWTSLVGQTW
ncbi:hypothetical protein H5410_053994 [Solanum commersonii]|uniref:Uncharacterized protein n=1 Tax=Solanum commersonii TaxID=4109 RepID=A0A9J5X6J7_SOLCO|nr:hypothetical protein H5410_053994 [Solanum commersonii]